MPPWALLLVVPCSVAALVFWKAGLQALQLLMLPAVIWLAVLAAFGTAVARSVSVPIGYLYFAMPAWNILSVPLQELTVHAVALVAPLVGLPATVSGTSFAFPNGARFVVTLACSGVGFLAQGLAVAVLLGSSRSQVCAARRPFHQHGAYRPRYQLGPVICCWPSVLSGMDNVIVSQRHLEFGYVLFVIVLVAFVWAATRRTLPEPEARAPRLEAPPATAYLVTIIALVAGPLLILWWARSGDADSTPRAVRMPPGENAWHGPLPVADATWRPVFVGTHSEQHVAYENVAGHVVEAVAWVTVQQQGRELVNEGNSLLGQEACQSSPWRS
jgi:hypothetical protein